MPAEPTKGVRVCPKCGAAVPITASACKCGQPMTPMERVPTGSSPAGGSRPEDADRVKDRVRHQDPTTGEFRPPPGPDPAPRPPPPPADADEPDSPAGPVIVVASDAVDHASDSKSAPSPAPASEPQPESDPVPPPVSAQEPDPAPANAEPGSRPDLARFGVHAERARLAIGAGAAGLVFGGALAPDGSAAAFAVLIGVFAAAVALWAPSTGWLRAGIVLVAAGAVVLRLSPLGGIFLLPASLAIATAPRRGIAAWVGGAVGVGVLVALPLVIAYTRGMPEKAAAIVTCLVAIAAIAVSHRIASAGPAGSR